MVLSGIEHLKVPRYMNPATADFSAMDSIVYNVDEIKQGFNHRYYGVQCNVGLAPGTGIYMPGAGSEDMGEYLAKVVNALNTSMSEHRSLSVAYSTLVGSTLAKADSYYENCKAFEQSQYSSEAEPKKFDKKFDDAQISK